LIVVTIALLAISNNLLGVDGDCTKTCLRFFNVNFKVNFPFTLNSSTYVELEDFA